MPEGSKVTINRMRDAAQVLAVFGLRENELPDAMKQIWMLDSRGLLSVSDPAENHRVRT